MVGLSTLRGEGTHPPRKPFGRTVPILLQPRSWPKLHCPHQPQSNDVSLRSRSSTMSHIPGHEGRYSRHRLHLPDSRRSEDAPARCLRPCSHSTCSLLVGEGQLRSSRRRFAESRHNHRGRPHEDSARDWAFCRQWDSPSRRRFDYGDPEPRRKSNLRATKRAR
jgi:hypothetical protein